MKKLVIFCMVLTLAICGFSDRIYLKVLKPNGGENLKIGNNYQIKWDSNYNGLLDIYLYKGNMIVGKIANSIRSNSKLYNWKAGNLIGKKSGKGNGYRIKIQGRAKDPKNSVSDTSNGPFLLSSPSLQGQKFSTTFNSRALQKKSPPPQESGNQTSVKPDLIVKGITTFLFRNNKLWSFYSNIWVNEPLELDVRIENIFREYGKTNNNFQIKVQFRWGYSGPVHKQKIITISKKLDPGEGLTERVVYGKVKSTPDVLYIKVTVDSSHAIVELNESNNEKEIEVRVVDPQ